MPAHVRVNSPGAAAPAAAPAHGKGRSAILMGFGAFQMLSTAVAALLAGGALAYKGLVESGFGYSILPEYALKEPNKFIHTLRIKKTPLGQKPGHCHVCGCSASGTDGIGCRFFTNNALRLAAW